MGSKAQTIGLVTLAGLLSSSLAWADPGQTPVRLDAPAETKPAPKVTKTWPKALKFRNARYADLKRVDDVKGDERERMFHTAYLKRVDDRLGDLEEARRYRAWSGEKKKLVRFANVARDPGLSGDREEQKLSRMSLARSHANFRRRGIIRSEELPEIQAYHRNYERWGAPNSRGFMIGKGRQDKAGADNRKARDQRRENVTEARPTRREDDELDRKELGGRHRPLRTDTRELAAQEAKDAKDAARLEARLERDSDRDDAKGLERNEKANERADDRATDREQERTEEKTVLQEETKKEE